MRRKKIAVVGLCLGISLTACAGSIGSAPAVDSKSEVSLSESATPVDPDMSDEERAAEVAALIDAIYVQKRTDETDAQCETAKAAWDALTDSQKALVEGEEASPEYFGLDTGDAKRDDPLNSDGIGEKEILVVSFGTSYNDSRTEDIGGIEKAVAEAFSDWSVRRAFTAQIIINHIQARDGVKIDNMDQALERAVANGVKELIVAPTHLMQGAEYDELCKSVADYEDKFETVRIAKPMLGDVGKDEKEVNEDKEIVAKAVYAASNATDDTAVVFLGHGTSHKAAVTYSQMQTQMATLGFKNAFVGTVEGEPEETEVEAVIEAIKAAGYKKVILRPLMVVAGDHANNDMAGDDEDSWKSEFLASGEFEEVTCQIAGLGSIPKVQQIYVSHIKDVLK